ncbi:RNA polymerase sigma factor [Parapedobacter sp. 10938]|uniref:RNA polymerase sigma factor n=1 Tax=Parapedobacter flavus TaxID=3110225 RepID=UPI002DB76DB1|nr:sigma-70 family RNA polymerase sigma factor [Parapedobacter sp. 10938]MEC3879621.1 sigma-70 family RNA polymerase sigma factor [Parapedobacter sp. 10938]
MHPDQRFITYLQCNDNQGIAEIYTLYAPKIARMIQYNSGDAADAADIMQEALMDICRMSADGKFRLTCPFEAFLVMVCKRKWLNVIKKKSGSPVTKSIDDGFIIDKSDEQEAERHTQQLERERTVMQVLSSMGERCREIIQACMGKAQQEQVAQQLGLTYAYLRKKKSECMAELGRLVKAHPLFKR